MSDKDIKREDVSYPDRLEGEQEIDRTLRPIQLVDFVGQTSVVENLKLYIKAAKGRDEPLDHVLLFGPPGLGKTTLANIVACELGVDIMTTSGPALDKPGDLAGLLTKLGEKDVLFIDEVHRLNSTVEEYLYSAMEEYVIDIMIDRGPNARSVRLNLPGFTLIGATTRAGLLTSPMRDRFGVVERLDYYKTEHLCTILERSSRILDVKMEKAATEELAKRSRGTPRIANRLLKRTRDYAQVEADGYISLEVANSSLTMLRVDETGLDEMDNRIVTTIIRKFNGGPVGLSSLAVAVGEESTTIEEVYEPFLIKEGFLERTPRGRQATATAYRHFGFDMRTNNQTGIFRD